MPVPEGRRTLARQRCPPSPGRNASSRADVLSIGVLPQAHRHGSIPVLSCPLPPLSGDERARGLGPHALLQPASPRGGRIWARGVWRRLRRAVFSRPAAADALNGAAGLRAQTKDGCHAPGLHAGCSHGGPPPPSPLLTSPSPPTSLSDVPPMPTCSQKQPLIFMHHY